MILDPWNGSGTTTAAAASFGYGAVGFDINPVSVTVAKGRLFSQGDIKSVEPLTLAILDRRTSAIRRSLAVDPLATWFDVPTVESFRGIEQSIRALLLGAPAAAKPEVDVEQMSNLAAFFYVALFRTVREHLAGLKLSNPTWIKRATKAALISVSAEVAASSFLSQTRRMIDALNSREPSAEISSRADIRLASSDNLPLETESVDFVLSSPPYCTRIDYGIATLPELATLGVDIVDGLRKLRDKLIGTPTITGRTPDWCDAWGKTCLTLLRRIKDHQSRASESYYLKTYVQYFDSIFASIAEISRCLRKNGTCFLVVQDSFYKEIYNDLPKIFEEISANNGLTLKKRNNFQVARTLAGINSHSKAYRNNFSATEAVLHFTK